MGLQPCPTVLIVDDEPIIRLYEAELAEEAGFRALEAASADEALDTLETSDDVDIVVTDVRMPGSMDGLALAETVRHRWPDKVIVIASAHIRRPAPDNDSDTVVLPKPFTPNELIGVLQGAALRRQLGRSR
jgi:two-component system, response regulator PdtaR